MSSQEASCYNAAENAPLKPQLDTKPNQYFNTGIAVKEILEGIPLKKVFPPLRSKLSEFDLTNIYIRDSNYDGRKPRVNTLRTAASIDAANILNAFPITIFGNTEQERRYVNYLSPSEPITPVILQGPLNREALEQTTTKVGLAIDYVASSHDENQVLGRVLDVVRNDFRLGLRFRPNRARSLICEGVKEATETASIVVPEFLRMVVDEFYAIEGYYPNFETFWQSVVSSKGLLMRPTVRDVRYLEAFRDELKIPIDEHDKTKYAIDTSKLSHKLTHGGGRMVRLSPNGQTAIEIAYNNKIGENGKWNVTGCPAGIQVKAEEVPQVDLITEVLHRTGKIIQASLKSE